MATIVPFGGLLADYLRKSGLLSTTTVRKVFNCGGFGMEGIFFLVVAHAKTAVSIITNITDLYDFKIKFTFYITHADGSNNSFDFRGGI